MTREHVPTSASSRTRLTAILLSTTVVSACNGAGGTSNAHFDSFVPLTATLEARIGSVDDPDVGFSRIGRVDVDRDGKLYVLESAVPEIRVYGADGQIVRRIGRSGGGPGEFEGAPRFGVVGDTIWAFDNRNMRITLFGPDGTVLSTGVTTGLRILLPGLYGTLMPYEMRPDGKFISFFGRIASIRDDPPTGVEPTDSIPVPFVLFDPSGDVADTVGWAPKPPPRMWRRPGEYDEEYQRLEIAGERVTVPRAPTTMPWWVQLTDSYIVVETPIAERAEEGVVMVTRLGLTGDTVYGQTLRYRPDPYTDAALDSIAAHAARGGESGGMVPYSPGAPTRENWRAIARILRDEMDFPPFQIPIGGPWVAQDGSVWLRRWDGTTPEAEYFILDPDGNPKGRLELPADVQVRWNAGDEFWAIERDEFEVQWLARYRIRPS